MVSSNNYNITIGPGHGSGYGAVASLKLNHKKEEEDKFVAAKDAKIKYHKIKESEKHTVQGNWPDDYVVKEVIEASTKEIEKNMELMNRYCLIRFNMPSKRTVLHLKSCYKIDQIASPERFRGAGTKAVQTVLERSLADKDTEGRIVVYAEVTDGQSSPAGFFYKLGFRFLDNSMNDVMETWARRNIRTELPSLTGLMYLPKQNINKLMMYGKNF